MTVDIHNIDVSLYTMDYVYNCIKRNNMIFHVNIDYFSKKKSGKKKKRRK